MKINATDIRTGSLIEIEGKLLRVVKARHVHVGGRGGAYMQVEVRDIENDSKSNLRLRTDEKVERPFLESRPMLFLYAEDDGFVLMNEESFEQVTLPAVFLEGQEGFLLPDMVLEVDFYEGRIIAARLPLAAELTVSETEPHIKGSTASASYKPAKMETGVTVMVPPFIGVGEKIRVNTETGEYIERV